MVATKNKHGISLLEECKRAPVELRLPWPPSVNNAYRSLGVGRVVKTKIAREYFSGIAKLIQAKRIPSFGKSRLKILIRCYPPDNRRRDLGNLDKVLMDTLEYSGLFENDSQIDNLHYVRRPASPPGFVEITIEEI